MGVRHRNRHLSPHVLATAALVALLAAACRSAPPVAPTVTLEPARDLVRAGGEITADVRLDDLCRTHFADAPSTEGRLIGLMTDSGSIHDGGFNQFAYEGLQAAARCFGFDTTYVASGQSDDYGMHLRELVGQGVEAVVTVGYPLTQTTTEVAAEHPGVAFIGLDQAVEDAGDNYTRITFRDDQGGFLAGVAAALVSRTGVLAVVAGPDDVPPVVALAEGFAAGAAHVDPSLEVVTTHLPSFSDPEAGATAAAAMIDRGADVVFGPAGYTGSGAILAAAQQGRWVVGVDQDQYLTTFEGGAVRGAQLLVTSSVKRVDLAVFLELADLARGVFEGDAVVLDAASGGVSYAPPHDADLPADVHEQLESVRADLAAGRVRTGLEDDKASDAP